MNESATMIIYSDLDGTFLDHSTYSCADALPALKQAIAGGIPVVFCSSKTRAEIEVIHQYLMLREPFIVENGGAVYVPRGYLPSIPRGSDYRDGFDVIELGTPYLKLVETLRQIRATTGCRLLGFNDLTDEEIAADCGLTAAEARRAKKREYDEPFKFIESDPHKVRTVLQAIENSGFQYSVGGRYYHVHGENDKGRAVSVLTEFFRSAHGPLVTIGIGDSPNDIPLLRAVHLPVLVQRADGRHDPTVTQQVHRLTLIDGVGPVGWRQAVMSLMENVPSVMNRP